MPGVRVALKKKASKEIHEDTESLDTRLIDLRVQVASMLKKAEAAEAERKALQHIVEQQGAQIASLTKRLEVISGREDDLKKMLLTASAERDELRSLLRNTDRERDELYRRTDDVYTTLYSLHSKVAAIERNGSDRASHQGGEPIDTVDAYQQLVRQIRDVVRTSLPHDAAVMVASKGDNDLLKLYGRRAWHFPQTENSIYAGHQPPDSTAAIVQMEALRAKGADYLLIPNTMFSWLDHRVEFKRYLETYYRLMLRREDACLIFALRGVDALITSRWQSEFREAIASCGIQLGQTPSILDWNTGLNLAARFPELAIFSPGKADQALPYIDESVDIVAVASWDFISRTEAQRVAKAAVMKFSQQGSAHEPALEIEWKLDLPSAAETLTSSIVLPSCNSVAQTQSWLTAVTESLPRNFKGEIIVVDGGSTDEGAGGLQRLAGSDPRVRIHRNRKSGSFLDACNQGAKAATGDILIFVNTVVLPLAGWLPPLLQIFRDYPKAGAVGGKHLYSDGRLREAGGVVFANGSIAGFGNLESMADTPLFNFVREVDYCSVPCLATRRLLFKEVNGFETAFDCLDYGAADYGLKIRDRDWRVYYQPESAAAHLEERPAAASSSRNDENHRERSREMLIKRWANALKPRPAVPPVFGLAAWRHLVDQI